MMHTLVMYPLHVMHLIAAEHSDAKEKSSQGPTAQLSGSKGGPK